MLQLQLNSIEPYDKNEETWRVVIETPKGSHNKYKFDPKLQMFVLSSVLPEGMHFPYDFGFLPGTIGDDGDPLDVLLLMETAVFCGCLVPSRPIGVIQAEQTEDGKKEENDRLVFVPTECRTYERCRSMKDLDKNMLKEIEEFFVSYNRVRGKKFKVIGVHGPSRAESLAKKGMKKAQK